MDYLLMSVFNITPPSEFKYRGHYYTKEQVEIMMREEKLAYSEYKGFNKSKKKWTLFEDDEEEDLVKYKGPWYTEEEINLIIRDELEPLPKKKVFKL